MACYLKKNGNNLELVFLEAKLYLILHIFF